MSTLLLAGGFVPEFYEEEWEDIGGPESGPQLSGHPEALVYFLDDGKKLYEVVVEDDKVTTMEESQSWGPGPDEQF